MNGRRGPDERAIDYKERETALPWEVGADAARTWRPLRSTSAEGSHLRKSIRTPGHTGQHARADDPSSSQERG